MNQKYLNIKGIEILGLSITTSNFFHSQLEKVLSNIHDAIESILYLPLDWYSKLIILKY